MLLIYYTNSMNVNDARSLRRPQAERRATTRRALLDAARQLFSEQGYTDVTVEAVVRKAGITRGALYYHFTDKRDLFRAVVEEIEEEIHEQVRAAATAAGEKPRGALAVVQAGNDAFLDACLGADVQRILLRDGPAVLGWEEWHALEARYALRQIEIGIEALIEAGLAPPQPVRPLAHLIHGATIEAALYIVRADNAKAARDEIGPILVRLFGGLANNAS